MNWLSRRMAGIILALATALALGGCSAVKLGYSSLPSVGWWWLDSYFDFSDEQEPRVRDELAALHTWHRQQELPRVIELLARLEQMAPGEVTAQQACAVSAQAQARLMAIAERAEPAAVSIASGLQPRQLRHLASHYRKNSQRFHREMLALPRAEQLEKRYTQVLDRMETLYGTLDAPQRDVLRQRIQATAWDPSRLQTEWQRRRDELLKILARIREPAVPSSEAAALLHGWIERIAKPADPAYRAYQDALLQENCATFAAVHQSTTPAQREQAARRLRAWQRDLRELVLPQP